MSKALNYLSIARRGGNVETGEENSKMLVKMGKARLMFVAKDASDGAKRRAEGYVFECSTPLIEVPFTKEEISNATGRPGCSMAAFKDLGLATSFVEALQAEYGDAYKEQAEALRAKLAKAAARKGAPRKTGNRRKSI